MEETKDDIYAINTGYKTIREWSEDEQPRERLMKHGAAALTNAELIAILLRSGAQNFSALDAAKELIGRFPSLTDLASCDYSQYKTVKGLGEAKSVTLAAAFELGKRIETEPFSEKKIIKAPEDIAGRYIPRFRGVKQESFTVVLLNSSNHIIRDIVISKGSLNASIVHPREVFKTAILESAASIILLHNHPSGNPTPSKEDLNITEQLKKAGEIIDIEVVDHIIIAGETFTSLTREGLM